MFGKNFKKSLLKAESVDRMFGIGYMVNFFFPFAKLNFQRTLYQVIKITWHSQRINWNKQYKYENERLVNLVAAELWK